MTTKKPTVVITGVAGNLGRRLLPLLSDFSVVGVDFHQLQSTQGMEFVQMDLGREESCRELLLLLRETNAQAVVHLAFVIDPVRTGVLDLNRMWLINVAGTARVVEAITEANRNEDEGVKKFIHLSSVSA